MAEEMSGDTGPRKTSLLRASAIMASGTMVSRLLGFIRSAMLLAAIGAAAGGVNAAFQTANTLPNTVFNLLASGVLDAILVPQIVGALKRKSGDEYVNKLLTLAGTLLFIVTVATMVAAPLLVTIMAAGYDPAIRSLAIAFALLCLPQIFFYGVYNLLGELLNARGVFGPYMWAPVVNNVIGIAGLGLFLILWGASPERFDVTDLTSAQFWLLGGSATLGVICQALFLLWPMKRAGIRFRPDFRFRGTSYGSASRVAGWTFATLGVAQIGVLSSNNIAALADTWGRTHEGLIVGISASATAFMIFMVPQSLIAVSLATAVFTRLAAAAVDKDHPGVARAFHLGVESMLSLTLLATALLAVAAVPVMQAVNPAATDTQMVRAYAWVLLAFLPGLAAMGVILMSQRVFYAYEDAKPVFQMVIVPNLLQVLVGWSLLFTTPARWWVAGAALAESVCRLAQAWIGLRLAVKRNPHINAVRVLRTYASYGAAALAAIAVGWPTIWLIGIDTVASGIASRLLISFGKILLVSVVASITYFVALRFIAPAESSRTLWPLLTRAQVPLQIRTLLAASPAPAGDAVTEPEQGGSAGSDEEEAATSDSVGDSVGDNSTSPVIMGGKDLPGTEEHMDEDERLASHLPGFDPDATDIPPSVEGASWTDSPTSGEGWALPVRPGDEAGAPTSAPTPPPPASQPEESLGLVKADTPTDAFEWTPPDEAMKTQVRVASWEDIISGADESEAPSTDTAGATDWPIDQTVVRRVGEDENQPDAGASSDAVPPTEAYMETIQRTIGEPVTSADSAVVADTSSSGHDPSTAGDQYGPLDAPTQPSVRPNLDPEATQVRLTTIPAPSPNVHAAAGTAAAGAAVAGTAATGAAASTQARISHTPASSKRLLIDPTMPTLVLAGALVVMGAVWGINTATAPVSGPDILQSISDVEVAQSQAQSEAVATPEGPAEVAPSIISASVLSWDDDGGDHDDLAINMIDGNPETQWHSRYYDYNFFNDDNTVTLLFKLREVATVREITLTMDPTTEGGELVVRSVNPDTPREGTELAVTALSPTTVITLAEPVTTDAISLSFRLMPTAVDGRNWAWVNDVSIR